MSDIDCEAVLWCGDCVVDVAAAAAAAVNQQEKMMMMRKASRNASSLLAVCSFQISRENTVWQEHNYLTQSKTVLLIN
jgi:ferredoxin